MKVCSFGTTRLDFHIYKPELPKQDYEEIKTDTLEIKVGGSVFNTTTLLSLFNTDLTYYTILGNDELSLVSKNALKEYGIKYICTSSIKSMSPVTFIHLDSDGEKTMYSYDGNTYADDVIDILVNNCQKYDAFFTSCYEINKENYLKLQQIFRDYHSQRKKTFLNLSPLVYRIPAHVWEGILPFISVLAGTEKEFLSLVNTLNLNQVADLIKKYNIAKLFITKGSRGSSVITREESFDHPVTPMKSGNLTGCGDAFNAGVILGELNGLTTKRTVELATSIASCVVRFGFKPREVVHELDLNSFI